MLLPYLQALLCCQKRKLDWLNSFTTKPYQLAFTFLFPSRCLQTVYLLSDSKLNSLLYCSSVYLQVTNMSPFLPLAFFFSLYLSSKNLTGNGVLQEPNHETPNSKQLLEAIKHRAKYCEYTPFYIPAREKGRSFGIWMSWTGLSALQWRAPS